MLRTFFTSDSHFGHANIIRYCQRPFADADEMDSALIRIWNSVVDPRDTVYHLGDFHAHAGYYCAASEQAEWHQTPDSRKPRPRTFITDQGVVQCARNDQNPCRGKERFSVSLPDAGMALHVEWYDSFIRICAW